MDYGNEQPTIRRFLLRELSYGLYRFFFYKDIFMLEKLVDI
jgi:hypothetical protein